MDRKLMFIIIGFFIFLILFSIVVIRSEYRNMEELREEYPNLSEEAYNYRKAALNYWPIRLFLKFLMPLVFLLAGLSRGIGIFAEFKGRNLLISSFIFILAYFLIYYLINIPLDYFGGFLLRHEFGLSNQSHLRWFELLFKGFILNVLTYTIGATLFYYILKRSPRRWWLYIGLLAIPISVFILIVNPMYIDPLFNKYTDIQDKELETKIRDLLIQADIGDAAIFEVDKSRDTRTMNAYVTGVLNSKRIVFWDNTLNNLDDNEVLSIAAHEIGHYKLGHIWKSIILGGMTFIIFMYLLYKTSNWMIDKSNGRFGFRQLYSIGSIPLFLLVINFYTFFASPMENGFSRYIERQADAYEIQLTKDREGAISSMEKLFETSLGLPRPSNIYKFWYHSHPSLEERIDFYKNHPTD